MSVCLQKNIHESGLNVYRYNYKTPCDKQYFLFYICDEKKKSFDVCDFHKLNIPAFCVVKHKKGKCIIKLLSVQSEASQMKFGTHLVHEVIDYAKKLGCSKVKSTSNPWCVPCSFKKLGFEENKDDCNYVYYL